MMRDQPVREERRSILEDRRIEFDGLAVVMLALGFAGVAAFAFWIVSSAAQSAGIAVWIASALIGLGVIAGWVFGYPRHAAIPAMSFAFVVAIAVLPYMFDMNGALLREAAGAPASRVVMAAGLYVGGLGVVLLAFIVFGFIGPLVGAMLAVRRREPNAPASLRLHIGLGLGAIAVLVLSRLPLFL